MTASHRPLPTAGPLGLAAVLLGLAAATHARADEADANRLLRAMSDYLAAEKVLSFAYDSSLDLVTSDLQQISLAASGTVALSRPDQLHATRTGGFADVEMFFDGRTVYLLGKHANAFAGIEAPGDIANLVQVLRDGHGFPMPAADLLETDVYAALTDGAGPLMDLGSGVIGGVECDHVAARTAEVDWQIWIAQGDAPYPCRYTITSRMVATSPSYTLDISDWKTGEAVGAVDFEFDNSTGAVMQDLADIPDLDLPSEFAIGGAQ
jgi:hypothetical protein